MFYKSLTGQIVMTKVDDVAILDHFSSPQVLLLFVLMLLMMVERMLYRTRKNQVDEASGNEWFMHTLTVKLVIYAVIVAFVHFQCGFYFPVN